MWNPFRSKLGAGIVGGIGACPVKPGAKVLYLGGASGTTVSHVSDMVGPEGAVLNALIFFGTSSVTKRLKKDWEGQQVISDMGTETSSLSSTILKTDNG